MVGDVLFLYLLPTADFIGNAISTSSAFAFFLGRTASQSVGVCCQMQSAGQSLVRFVTRSKKPPVLFYERVQNEFSVGHPRSCPTFRAVLNNHRSLGQRLLPFSPAVK